MDPKLFDELLQEASAAPGTPAAAPPPMTDSVFDEMLAELPAEGEAPLPPQVPPVGQKPPMEPGLGNPRPSWTLPWAARRRR